MVNPFFKRSEFACQCGCGFDAVDAELLEVLTDLREHFDRPVIINSGNRCQAHNASIGGSAPNSKHTKGIAADVRVKGVHADDVADYLENKYPNKYGIGRYIGRTHIDVRETLARWDYRGH
jgi:uncharacterized protein YcbK (DUF882 family)